MRTQAFLVVLAAGALAAPDTVEKTADRFLDAFKSAKGPLAAQIALRPPGEVPYALVIERLLEKDELDAAQKVADLREGAPDGTGLRVLVSAARGGVRPEKELWMKLQAAERKKFALHLMCRICLHFCIIPSLANTFCAYGELAHAFNELCAVLVG